MSWYMICSADGYVQAAYVQMTNHVDSRMNTGLRQQSCVTVATSTCVVAEYNTCADPHTLKKHASP